MKIPKVDEYAMDRMIEALALIPDPLSPEQYNHFHTEYFFFASQVRDFRQFLFDMRPTYLSTSTRWTPWGIDKLEYPGLVEKGDSWWERLKVVHHRLKVTAEDQGWLPMIETDFPLLGEVKETPPVDPYAEVRLANGRTPREQEEAYWLERGLIKKPFAERERERTE